MKAVRTIKELFLKEDSERVDILLAEFDRFINLSKLALSKNEHEKAEEYAHHALSLVAEVRKLKELKKMYDESHQTKQQAKLQGVTNHMLEQRRLWF